MLIALLGMSLLSSTVSASGAVRSLQEDDDSSLDDANNQIIEGADAP